MGKLLPPNLYGSQLSIELARLRLRAGLGQEQAAPGLHLSFQKISRIENGQVPGYHELDAILKFYEASVEEIAACHRLRELALQRGWWRDYGLPNNHFCTVEDVAHTITEYRIGHIPPLLQTPEYARALVLHAESVVDSASVTNSVEATVVRQQRLKDDRKLTLHSIIPESVLRVGVGRRQVKHLLDVMTLENVTIQIVLDTAGPHPGMLGSLAVAQFPGEMFADRAYTFSTFGTEQYADDGSVTLARSTLDTLGKVALPAKDSMTWMYSFLQSQAA